MRYLLALLALLCWVGSIAAQPCTSYIVNSTGGIVCSVDGVGNSLYGVIHRIDVSLSSSQLLNLHSSPVLMIPAPGAGNVLIVYETIVHTTFNTTGYVVHGDAADYYYKIDGSGSALVIIQSNAFIQTANNIQITNGTYSNINLPSDIENQPIVLFNPVANMTGGDGTAVATLFYGIYPVK